MLGIDPGSIVCGYGVVEKNGSNITLVEYGVVEAKKRFESLPQRLEMIYERLGGVIERSLPDEAAVESVFFAKNAQSLAKLSHARGVAMLAAAIKRIPIMEYSAKEVKRSVTGNGNASKEQVQFMTRTILKIEEMPDFFDATDALAVAICHCLKRNSQRGAARSWKQFVEDNPKRVLRH